jgi:hypothetical protein
MHVLLKNSSSICLYFLTLPLVGVCVLSMHQNLWEVPVEGSLNTSGICYLSKNRVKDLETNTALWQKRCTNKNPGTSLYTLSVSTAWGKSHSGRMVPELHAKYTCLNCLKELCVYYSSSASSI